MLTEQDTRALADIERRLRHETTPRFLCVRLTPRQPRTPPRWLAYVMAVVVPLLLPAVSVLEMRPLVTCVCGLVASTVVLPRWVQREARGNTHSGNGPTSGH
ncbi:DUF3040 domain-containing protein [Pseudonocardia sp. Cha107L01]|uniref:DUF3040 domain-containing protein n=1 Tax=Pseudonocardia sp. Cha107L01 TaxID=3457576 RepID=UPI00403E59FD